MALAIQRLSNLVSLSISHIALNPVLTGSLLWVLTKGPPQLRARLYSRFASLRDPQRHNQIVKALKWLLTIGLTTNINKQLNKLALNSWRVKSEKSRWNWSQEIAVVTGGCSGIGELVVKRLARKGVKVAVLDIQQLPVGLQGFTNVTFFACDITDPTAVNTTAERIRATLGSPSILVNNAGIAQAHSILDTSDEWLRKIFDVNLLSNFTTVKAFLPAMIAKNKGHVVTVASTASFSGIAFMVDYCSTKAGVLSFHEGLNQELKHRYNAPNVLTTSVHPNWVRTPLIAPFEKTLRAAGSPIIEPEEVADAIVAQIVSCSGAQVFLPSVASRSAFLRAFPNWLQEAVRSGVSKTIAPCAPK
ncbi:dehydrogenase/reductase SDR family member 8 precursor [Melanomma pulvis-pyrius CBS 109.77]|uniref:Short-chain dehydrogenase/reductase 3 n=1 Tax=Melanomma pulvis-pyrius CBS 109.77 TaxID=1314802 RepID=A0A6A6WZR6_9PLEO|nr:dehydrogenase/reductase SDR family member 8 precursor [Melanomma pulvis-pyrius CBS 109.77]